MDVLAKIKNQKVFVAMSGGVDSSVAAALLKERGFEVRGVHLKMWSPLADLKKTDSLDTVCLQQRQDRYDAMRVAAKLDIPFETWDFTKEYKQAVVEYMVREYAAGRTPNPDVMCNREIKFGVFLKKALERGADYVATGHYVRLRRNFKFDSKPGIKNSELLTAEDANKDQSYFLWTLTQNQLKHCLFPIGEFVKPEVREMARKFGLFTAEKPDSQGICFIGEMNVRDFLKNYISSKPGRVLTTSGKVVGEHEGLAFYTIGQREGLGIGGGIPYYVTDKDFKTDTLMVAEGPYDDKLFSKNTLVSEINWIFGTSPKFPLKCQARIRYRQLLQNCTFNLQSKTYNLQIVFDESQRAVTPGQSIVFYKGQKMLGGGTIV